MYLRTILIQYEISCYKDAAVDVLSFVVATLSRELYLLKLKFTADNGANKIAV